PYICGNVGSGTVQEMSEWVEYMTFDGVSPMAELRKQNDREEPWKIKYFAVGNENWGCGGNMRAEYYSDVFRRYAVYCRNYGENKLYKVACGPSGDDYHWTEAMMQNLDKRNTQGLALHYYTRTNNDWSKHTAPATNFPLIDYYNIIKNTWVMEELIQKHSAIMDQYDPEKDVALVVDEWGTWFKVEEGTNPGFLYQQNTMRDALVAAINLNLFNQHSDRVRMANIAQIVNVLQSVILTEGEKMVLTPTYHIFRMMKEHMETTLVHSYMENDTVTYEEGSFPALSQSVSINDKGQLIMTIANASLENAYTIDAATLNFKADKAEAVILTGGMGDFNTFEEPENVKEAAFTDFELKDGGIVINVPACSIIRFIIG
ncbi:MAG: alpha-N-arabinofuranosidase, partial [Christensenellaceae bacterium]|nr:alpha-N-arabinofuranosidase [Christensenellaceae bacterium]